MRRSSALCTAGLVIAALGSGPAVAGGEREPQPFPVAKTTILRDEDAVFYVEGRQRIPKNVEITVLRGVRIIGRGEAPTIEVEGRLKIHGVSGTEVQIEGVTIEPQSEFQEIKVSELKFTGGATIRTPQGKSCNGYFMLELFSIEAEPGLDLTLTGGSLEMSSVSSRVPVHVKALDTPGNSKGNSVKVEIRGCGQSDIDVYGLRGGLVVESVDEVIVRLSRLGGGLVAIRDWRKSLIFDGNKVDAARLEFTQPVAGRFRTAQFFKCDVYSDKVLFAAPPANARQTEEVQFERFYFERTGGTDRASVMKVVEDGTEKPAENGVRAKIVKLNERPLELAGSRPK